MPRSLRALTTSTALVVTAALLPLSAGPASAARTDPSPEPAPRAATGITIRDTAVASPVFVPVAPTSSRATTWPIGGGSTNLVGPSGTATGAPAQQLSRVQMRHYRVYGGVLAGVVDLVAAPDASTPSWVLVAFGNVSADGTMCESPAGSNIAFTSTDTDTVNNPVYDGARIQIKPFQFPTARTATWNCAFADTATDSTFATPYDSLAGPASLFRQKPDLKIVVKGRKLKRYGFTRIPVVIKNSSDTIATAPRVRLKVRTRGVAVRYNPRVGTIRPGTAKRGSIRIKDTRPGKGFVTLIVTSKDYRRKVRLVVREVRG
ncbi:hypothetical protein [Nocardioides rubriscoriae]|uniref:hypothetical protein n=1 Tax=Nocardioides rubriscoriae TaxID=642762 RepID=UPI0011DFF2B2|nr:hypothetical protein [Nocardioides rubriscoriae]